MLNFGIFVFTSPFYVFSLEPPFPYPEQILKLNLKEES